MKRVLRTGVILFAVAMLAVSVPALAKPVKVTAYQSMVHKGAKGDTEIEGGLEIEYDDIVITADRATMNMDAGIAKLAGKVSLVQKDVTINCDSMDLDIKKKTATVAGSVRLQKRETQAEKDETGKPKVSVITLTCARMEIFTNTQDFHASGSVSMVRDKQRARADEASYTSSEKVLILTGSVFIEGENKETIKCDRAELHTDQTMLAAEGAKMEITFEIEE